MPDTPTRLRSVLYVPGSNERALEKANELAADALILDLEDAVAPVAKGEARERVRAAVAAGRSGGRPVAIRVNSIGTEWHAADLRAAAEVGPDAIVVPKASSKADMLEFERALLRAGASDETRIWAMLETPAAVLRAGEIATASERLTVLVVGTNDLVNELRAEHVSGREPLLVSLSQCVLAARAAGKMVLDGVYNDIRDPDGFEAECLQGRRLGFDGKTIIHPGQVDICNRAFSPSDAEVEHARRVIEAFEYARNAGDGVATVDGRMIESLHVESARRVLALRSG